MVAFAIIFGLICCCSLCVFVGGGINSYQNIDDCFMKMGTFEEIIKK
jgi:hypothetical protein